MSYRYKGKCKGIMGFIFGHKWWSCGMYSKPFCARCGADL